MNKRQVWPVQGGFCVYVCLYFCEKEASRDQLINKTLSHFCSPWNWSKFTYPDHIYHGLRTSYSQPITRPEYDPVDQSEARTVTPYSLSPSPHDTIPAGLIKCSIYNCIKTLVWDGSSFLYCSCMTSNNTHRSARDGNIGKFVFIWGSISVKV